MITFVYGPPGSGKTHYIFEKLKEKSDNAFLIVPEQQTIIAERLSLELMPPSAQLGFEALNFTRLCNRVFRKYGGLSYHYINNTVKSLFMWRTLRELSPLLKEYGIASNELSLTDLMLSVSDELLSCSVTPTMLEAAAAALPDGSLRSKLLDVSLINAAYTNLVAETYDDKADDLQKLASVLQSHGFFSGCEVYIDSFTGFTAPEYAVVEQIFRKAKNVTVTLGCESPDCGLICCESICETAKRLYELAERHGKETEKIYLTGNFRAENAELRLLTTEFWSAKRNEKPSDTMPPTEQGNIRVIRTRDAYDEATAAVAFIKQEVARGLHYRDIVIVARNAADYEGIIDTALENAKIAYFMSKRSEVSYSPAFSLILSALRIKYLGFRAEDVLVHLKTGLCGFTLSDIDMFEEYITTWSISGKRFTDDGWSMNPDGYVEHISERGKLILSAANRVREGLLAQLTPLFTALDVAGNITDMCTAVYKYLVSVGLSEQLKRSADSEAKRGNRRAAADTLATWNILMDTLDDINTALSNSDGTLTVEELYRAVLLCAGKATVGAIPTGYDEVTVGSASLLRTGEVRCAIIIGLNEGEFPAAVSEAGVFTDSDRASLAECGIQLTSDTAGRAADELLYARQALTLPSERLYLLYRSVRIDGGLLRPSMLVNRMLSYFDYIKPEDFALKNPSDAIWSENIAAERLPELYGTPLGEAIKETLRQRGLWTAPKIIAEPECSVDPETAKPLFGEHMTLSQTRIESFLGCRFSYYCNSVLSLREDKKAEPDFRIIGTFIHSVLERFMRLAITENGIAADETEELVDRLIEEITSKICTAEQRSSNRLRHLFLRLRRLSLLMIRSLRQEMQNSEFRPAYFEYIIGKGGADPLVFKLKDGSTVSLRGIIDRVDLWKHDGEVYIRVVDYKTGEQKFSLSDIASGLHLQLVIYLFTLCRPDTAFAKEVGCDHGKAPIPAAANYLSSYLTKATFSRLPTDDEIFDRSVGKFTRTGFFLNDDTVLSAINREAPPSKNLLDAENLDRLRNDLETALTDIALEMRSGKIDATQHIDSLKLPCKNCAMSAVCRSAKKTAY